MASAIPSGPGRNTPVDPDTRKSAKAAGLKRNSFGELVLRVKGGTKKFPIFTERVVFPGDYIDDLGDK